MVLLYLRTECAGMGVALYIKYIPPKLSKWTLLLYLRTTAISAH